ncbi:MAG: hypothetical protein J6R34_04165 [Clostridia bacterium]|nr:hypothetical protein [Clostridia bacterium]
MILIEGKTYQDEKQALNALAFCHYPVTVSVDGKTAIFSSFDEAREGVVTTLKKD